MRVFRACNLLTSSVDGLEMLKEKHRNKSEPFLSLAASDFNSESSSLPIPVFPQVFAFFPLAVPEDLLYPFLLEVLYTHANQKACLKPLA